MKKLLLLALCLPLLQACTKQIEEPDSPEKLSSTPAPIIWPCWVNIWQNRSQVPIYFEKSRDIAFGIENKGYVLKDEPGLPNQRVWEYDINDKSWTPKGLFPGPSRLDATIVVVGTKAYFGLGFNFPSSGPVNYHDWWEYDPATDQWTPKADFPAAGRTATTAFAASGKAYVVGGYDREVTLNYLAQTWQYDPLSNAWEQKANFPGPGRDEAAGFGIGSKGYVGTGRGKVIILNNPYTIYYKDFYQYDALANTWTQKADYPNATRYRAFAFMIRGNGYIGGGYNASAGYRELYMYNHLTDQWIERTDYPGYGYSPHHFGNLFHFSTLDHGYVIEQEHLSESAPGTVQTMWRYVKKQYCPN